MIILLNKMDYKGGEESGKMERRNGKSGKDVGKGNGKDKRKKKKGK